MFFFRLIRHPLCASLLRQLSPATQTIHWIPLTLYYMVTIFRWKSAFSTEQWQQLKVITFFGQYFPTHKFISPPTFFPCRRSSVRFCRSRIIHSFWLCFFALEIMNFASDTVQVKWNDISWFEDISFDSFACNAHHSYKVILDIAKCIEAIVSDAFEFEMEVVFCFMQPKDISAYIGTAFNNLVEIFMKHKTSRLLWFCIPRSYAKWMF